MKPINYEGVSGVFIPDDEYQKLCQLVAERGELLDQLETALKKHDLVEVQHISALAEGVV